MGTQKNLNDNWTKTGSCEPTFMKSSYRVLLIKSGPTKLDISNYTLNNITSAIYNKRLAKCQEIGQTLRD